MMNEGFIQPKCRYIDLRMNSITAWDVAKQMWAETECNEERGNMNKSVEIDGRFIVNCPDRPRLLKSVSRINEDKMRCSECGYWEMDVFHLNFGGESEAKIDGCSECGLICCSSQGIIISKQLAFNILANCNMIDPLDFAFEVSDLGIKVRC